MNLLDYDADKKTNDLDKKGKILLISIGIVGVLAVFALIMLMVVKEQANNNKSVVKVNGQKTDKIKIEDLIIDGNIIYFPIKDIAGVIGYEAYNGEFKVETEDTSKCYVKNNYETTSFFEMSNEIYKLEVDNQKGEYKTYQIKNPVKNVNGKLYVSDEGLSIACNLLLQYDANDQRMEIYTLDNVEAQIANVANNMNLQLRQGQTIEDKKSMLKGWGIVQDGSGKCGIISSSGNEILGVKYQNINYNEYTNSFSVTDATGKVGIWKIENNQPVIMINNDYDSINLIDKNNQLYEVGLNGKYGIVSFDGKLITGLNYDKIGMDISKYDITNQYFVLDNLIPVQQENKWGVINTNGEIVIPTEYSQIGCDSVQQAAGQENIVIIKEYGIIVLKKDDKYGLMDWRGKSIIDFVITSIYYSSKDGSKKAYLESGNETYDIVELLENHGIQKYKPNDGEQNQWDF